MPVPRWHHDPRSGGLTIPDIRKMLTSGIARLRSATGASIGKFVLSKLPKNGRDEMTRSGIVGGVLVALVIGGAAAAFAVIWRPAIAAIDPPAAQAFPVDL